MIGSTHRTVPPHRITCWVLFNQHKTTLDRIPSLSLYSPCIPRSMRLLRHIQIEKEKMASHNTHTHTHTSLFFIFVSPIQKVFPPPDIRHNFLSRELGMYQNVTHISNPPECSLNLNTNLYFTSCHIFLTTHSFKTLSHMKTMLNT